MGYYKNQLIAQQVEVGDRLPQPKPAREHIALREPSAVSGWRLHLTLPRGEYALHVAVVGVTGLAVGFLLGGAL